MRLPIHAAGLALLALVLTSPSSAQPSDAAETYLAEAMAILKAKHINSLRVDWDELEAQARAQIADARTPADTHAAVTALVEALGEKHSYFMTPAMLDGEQAAHTGGDGQPVSPPVPVARELDGGIGYVQVPMLNMRRGGEEYAARYREALTTGLQGMDVHARCGWIVDLRGNSGGNMWPMLWGLDPLLGDAPFGYFITRTNEIPWARTKEGIMGARAIDPAVPPAFELMHADRPLALLMDGRTTSSGEMVALGLIGRPGVRTFGQPSGGYTTANTTERLSDGALLVVTVSTVADRNGQVADGPILPDENVPAAEAEAAARNWLATQCDGAA